MNTHSSIGLDKENHREKALDLPLRMTLRGFLDMHPQWKIEKDQEERVKCVTTLNIVTF